MKTAGVEQHPQQSSACCDFRLLDATTDCMLAKGYIICIIITSSSSSIISIIVIVMITCYKFTIAIITRYVYYIMMFIIMFV